MIIDELINKKNSKQELSYDEIEYIVSGFLNGAVSEDNMTLFLKSICNNSMTDNEIFHLTDIMVKSGKIYNLNSVNGVKVDKHSTGGVGDKTTLIIGPIVAACDVIFPKISGKSLGHTGGTIDKLESIPGFNVNLNEQQFIDNLNKVGMSIISQSESLVPADKKIYNLRDKTNTTMSIPLIASSIMSKKIACNADKILIDVKCGVGALLKTKEEAIKLSKILCKIGKKYNKETICIITNMNCPLGNMIGNSLEIKEVIEILNGKGNKNLRELCVYLSSYIISMAKNISIEEARVLALDSLEYKMAYNKFLELIASQGGDINGIKISDKIIEVKSDKAGYVNNIDALIIGNCSMKLAKRNDGIDYSVGIEIIKNIGDYVNVGDTLAKIYINDIIPDDILPAFTIESSKKEYKIIENIVKY